MSALTGVDAKVWLVPDSAHVDARSPGAVGTLYLHAGAGKTGTSALQLFFRNNRPWLAEQGIHYPAGLDGMDPRTKISSGNGAYLYRFLRHGEHWEDFRQQLERPEGTRDVLISSEMLAGAAASQIDVLRERVAELGFRLNCFYLVRNPDEWYLSAYQQHVKRHGFSGSFAEFCDWYALEFSIALNSYESALGEGALRLLSYEAGKSDIVSYVLHRGLGVQALPPQHDNPRINRSLTRFELEVLRASNRAQTQGGVAKARVDAHGTRTSNLLIAARPDVPASAKYREPMPPHIVERLSPTVDAINARLDPDSGISFAATADSGELTRSEREAATIIALILRTLYRSEDLARKGLSRSRAGLRAVVRRDTASGPGAARVRRRARVRQR